MPETHKKQQQYTAMALGNFDGIHRGHLSVLKKTLEQAEKNGFKACVLLFDEHPKQLLSGKRPPQLMTDESRDEMLENMGFEIVKLCFKDACNMSEEEFFKMLYEKYSVRAVCCGFNYRYAKNAKGNVQSLSQLCKKYSTELFVSDEVKFEDEIVSSTLIREEIKKGNIKKANKMLSRAFSYKFEVVSGDRRGRLLGFPTINQFFEEDFVEIRFGVYASMVKISDKWYPAVTNIGIRPTVNTERFRSETCILGFSGNLYGEKVEVFLLDFLRDEKKFENLEKLSEAIKQDAQRAKEIFKEVLENE